MKQFFLIIIIFFIVSPVYAKPGCCRGYGGVLKGQCYDGHLVCKDIDENGDNYVSPSCECENDTTSYDEDYQSGDLLHETTEDEELYDNYIENNHESNDIKKERKDYLGIGTLIAAVAGTSFVAGKKIEKRKRE